MKLCVSENVALVRSLVLAEVHIYVMFYMNDSADFNLNETRRLNLDFKRLR